MIIEEALKTFLADVNDGDTSQTARQTARSAVASSIGLRIYLGRRPQGSTGPAITIRRIYSSRYDDLAGEDELVQHLVDVTVWTKRDSVPPAQVAVIGENVRRAVTQYRGDWGDIEISGVTQERDGFMIPVEPRDASDDWTFAYSIGLLVTYKQDIVTAL